MPATEVARKRQGNCNRRPAVPVAIPLTYTPKPTLKDNSADKNNINTNVLQSPLSPPTSPPTASDATTGPYPATIINGTSIPSLDDRTQITEQTKGKPSFSGITKVEGETSENIESSDNGCGGNRSTTAANSAVASQDTPKATPIGDSKVSQYLQGDEHKEQTPLLSDNKSLKMAGSMTSPPGPALDSHNPILPSTVSTDHTAKALNAESHLNDVDIEVAATSFNTVLNSDVDPSGQQAKTVESRKPSNVGATSLESNGSEAPLRRGSEVVNGQKAGISQSGKPDLRAASIAALTIKALNDFAEARRLAASAPGFTSVNDKSISKSQAPTDENIHHTQAPTALANITPVMLQRHVQADIRNGMISPEGSDKASLAENQNVSGFRHASPVNLPFREEMDRRHHMHLPHPSQGSINFGSYPGSIHSSPAPHITAGGHQAGPYPPPPQVMHPAMSAFPAFPPGLGFSPQPTPQIMHSPGFNNFVRHHYSQSFGPTPSRTPGIENQHQFRHSPAHSFYADTPVLHGQHPHVPGYGHPPFSGMVSGAGVHQQNNTTPTLSTDLFRGPPMPPHKADDSLDGLVEYTRMQFNNPTFADFQLEVRFPAKEGKQPLPIQMPGHSIFFARSPCLGQLMAAGFANVMYNGMPSRVITLDLDDGFVRPASFWMALQRLYGGPLLTRDTMANPSVPDSDDGDIEAERFDLALGYAAAGHLLQMEPVVHHGVQAASHHLQWNTLVKALEFADAMLDPKVIGGAMGDGRIGLPRKYGPVSELLIPAILGFVTEHFLGNFELDTSAADPEQIRRLPKPNTFVKKHNPKMSGMKFGDVGLDDEVSDADNKEFGPTPPPSPQVILSSILLNLPFPLLKNVLESEGLGIATNGGFDAAQRAKIITDVVKERERRRVQATKNRQHIPLNASQLMAQITETQQDKTLRWSESVVTSGEGLKMTRELLRSPFGPELPA